MRNVESRLIKLEARRQRPNEILLIWRWPDADVKAATNGARFAPGDRVICLEWFGDGPLPAPRWYRDRLTSEFGVTEKEFSIDLWTAWQKMAANVIPDLRIFPTSRPGGCANFPTAICCT